MKRLLVLAVLLTAAAPAPAHFIWILPPRAGDSGPAQMVFSDTLAPDVNVPITKIAKTQLTARAGKGEATPARVTEAKDHYVVAPEKAAEGAVAVSGICQYGVLAKGKAEPFLLVYTAATAWQRGALKARPVWLSEGDARAALQIVPGEGQGLPAFRVLWQGKPASHVEVTLLVPGSEAAVETKSDEQGRVSLQVPKAEGYYGIRAKMVEKKAGAHDGKQYKEVRHYATYTFFVPAGLAKDQKGQVSLVTEEAQAKSDAVKADAGATKLLADARAARAVWQNFPGFSADLTVNDQGKLHKGKVEVQANGKVRLLLDDAGVKMKVQREIASLVAHRLPGSGALDTPCAFADDHADHPLGRLIKVLNDELHSSYRIRDRQIIEVNRVTGDVRFTITVLENVWNKEKQYLPISYVVNSWDAKSGALKSSVAHHHTWTRVQTFDLPVTLLTVRATPQGLESHQITFSNVQLGAANAK